MDSRAPWVGLLVLALVGCARPSVATAVAPAEAPTDTAPIGLDSTARTPTNPTPPKLRDRLRIPPQLVATFAPRGAVIVELGLSDPPPSANSLRARNERRLVGTTESMGQEPARDFELIVDTTAPPAVVLTALDCPSLPLRVEQGLWVRDHLGDARWRAAVAVSIDWSAAEACPQPFHTLGAVAEGRPEVSTATRQSLPDEARAALQQRLDSEYPGHTLHAAQTSPAFDGILAELRIGEQRSIVYITNDAIMPLDPGREPSRARLLSLDHVWTPCINGEATLVEPRWWFERRAEYLLLAFARCHR